MLQGFLLYRLNPLLFLLWCGGRYPVDHMVSFHHPAISLRLTRFDHLTLVAGVVELEAVLGRKERSSVLCISYIDISYARMFSNSSNQNALWSHFRWRMSSKIFLASHIFFSKYLCVTGKKHDAVQLKFHILLVF